VSVCEGICRYGRACRNTARWLTPPFRNQLPVIVRRVCGVHKGRFETFGDKCELLPEFRGTIELHTILTKITREDVDRALYERDP
jgi:hypothetical protein